MCKFRQNKRDVTDVTICHMSTSVEGPGRCVMRRKTPFLKRAGGPLAFFWRKERESVCKQLCERCEGGIKRFDRREGKGSGQGPCVINMWAVLTKRRPGVELGEVDGGALL